MLVKAREACPVKQKDGTWKVVVKEFEEEIPDLGRSALICNKCGWSDYPNRMEWCKAHIKKQSIIIFLKDP